MKSRVIHTFYRFFQRANHLGERIVREGRVLPRRMKAFGAKVALESFWDGLIPPGKSERYIATIAAYVDRAMQDVRACTDVPCAPEAGHSDGQGGAANQKT
ncbi:MAG: hypothetical protein ACI4O4_02610 [Candidatus Ventricola sp.]